MQTSIFQNNNFRTNVPLADRMRPKNLDEFVGQEHILGKGKLLRNLIENDAITSMILWGPPGVGKTTLAMTISHITKSDFLVFSATMSGIKEIKEVMKKAEEATWFGKRTVLFVDEIHRFNKAQQDAFLPHVEKGNIILIGATTENPSFEVNSALLSRAKVFVMQSLTAESISSILKNALSDEERGLGKQKINISEETLNKLAIYSNGDGRNALTILEMMVLGTKANENEEKIITDDIVAEVLGRKMLLYDKNGEEHYNLISALHKSMRNSDVQASVYWLARIIEAGEDPLYIARRIVRFASEDIGLAEPFALQMALNAKEAVHFLGIVEGNLALTQAVVYMAQSPKSNALYVAYQEAKKDAQNSIAEPVPLHLRNAETNLMKNIGYGKGYLYAHDFKEKVTKMKCLPDSLAGRIYYKPTAEGKERKILERMKELQQKTE